MTPYRIFAQAPEAALDPAAIVRAATRFFEADIDLQRAHDLFDLASTRRLDGIGHHLALGATRHGLRRR